MKYCLIITLLFASFVSSQEIINVTSRTLKVLPMQSDGFLVGFYQGDKIDFNLQESKGKVVNTIQVLEYPSGNPIITEYKTSSTRKTFTANRTGIFMFKITNASLGSRFCSIKIDRTPKDESSNNFNTTVMKRVVHDTTYTISSTNKLIETTYSTKTIIDHEKYYINSGSNAYFKSGKSRISIPINLPSNTVEWFYTFSSSRNEEEINANTENLKLASDLMKLIDNTGVASIGIDLLSAPPGANYCDIYLIDYENRQPFLAKLDFSYYPSSSRANIKSGVIKSTNTNKQLYLGIKNPDSMHGIHVMLEVVAIVKEDIFEQQEIKIPHVTSKEEYYIEN